MGILDDVMDGINAKESTTTQTTVAESATAQTPAAEEKTLHSYSDKFKEQYGERKQA